ncbi:hypothetical protein BCR33DRAFT_189420 [Rhizoclosmatium globosum]|uniref:TIR domain-containing protein n=1 Tax=Rhizoclosmatium globosum TaxID=329046 RepID=A0A1Y2D1P1_9FUNG|nr:hypothetical protein BCR33DRAFT_189420 [Rhizoclosmatium globosum]|eukprot:ORY53170.1 hypothetical protein BCR33DRAFT_189420 [Rhizoclosmatium globosum]
MPSEQENFFTLLDLLPPKHGGKQTDLDPYFGIKAYTKAAFDPYAAPETQEKLLECSELPLFDYQPEKIWGLCRTVKADWKLLWRPHQHYELGNCLIFESQSRKHKLGTYHLLSNYINAVEAVVLSLFVLTNLISWYKNYMTSTGYVYLAAYLGKAEDTNGYWHTTSIFLGPGTLIMSIIVLAWALTRNERTPCGLLRYLRQIGKPLVEEVMFSYSWQPGIQNDIRCLARGILKNEIGVWIDVLKLISGDKASRVTRTVAAHARFVVVCLTAAYVNSPACFIELYEALNAPVSAKDRVIVFWPDEAKMGLSYKEEDMKRVTALAGQLEKKGITVIREYSRLIDYLNHRVIYSVDLSHYIWWLKHVGSGFGVPDKAILPTVSKLKRFNLFGKFAPKNAVTISNLWLSSDMRKTTEKGYAFHFSS